MIRFLIVLVLACAVAHSYEVAGQTNWTNSTEGCASVYEFKFPNGTCSPDCPYPYSASWNDGSSFCSPPCLTGYYQEQLGLCVEECNSEFIREQDGVIYCDQDQNVPNPGNNTNSTQGCDSVYEFRYPNGSCLPSCPYPHRADWRDDSYFCSPPCSNGDYYYTLADTCVDECQAESIRVEDDIIYCDKLPGDPNSGNNGSNSTNSTGGCDPSINQFKFPNGSCFSECPEPRIWHSWEDGFILCYPPCIARGDDIYYYAPEGRCVDSCERTRVEGDTIYCDQLPEGPNPGHNGTNSTNSTQGCDSVYEFKYPNGSCLTSCPYPHRADWHDGSYFCFPPCSDSSYYYAPTDSCVDECEQIRIEDDIVYCDELPDVSNPGNNNTNNTNSTEGCPSIYEFKYPNGSCLSSCSYPRRADWRDGFYFCFLPCSDYSFYYAPTDSCVDECEQIRVEDDIVYCDQLPYVPNPGNNETNNTNSTQGCDSKYVFKFPNGTCSPDCPYPYSASWHDEAYFCSPPCSTGYYNEQLALCVDECSSEFIREQDGVVYCDQDPNTPNPGNQGCNSVYEFKYPNGSCLSSCPYPRRADWRGNSYFCSSPCSNGDYYYALTNTCVDECEQVRVEDGIAYCEQLPDVPNPGNNGTNNTNSTQGCDSIYEFKYPNGSCLPSCPYPHRADWKDGSYFCFPPCSEGDSYYSPTDSCVDNCEQIRVEDDIVYCDQLPNIGNNNTNNTNSTQGCDSVYEFKYPNGSCLASCPYPHRADWHDGSYFCFPPCSGSSYYYAPTDGCVDECEQIRVEDDIVYCDQLIDDSNSGNSTNSSGVCDPSINQFKYPNGSCYSECSYPRIRGGYQEGFQNCYSICRLYGDHTSYYAPTDSCVDNCARIRVEDDLVYCEQLPENPNPVQNTSCKNGTGLTVATIKYDMTQDQFESAGGENYFITTISQVLGIQADQIEITEIKIGSVVIVFNIQTVPSSTMTAEQLKKALDIAVYNCGMRLYNGVNIISYESYAVDCEELPNPGNNTNSTAGCDSIYEFKYPNGSCLPSCYYPHRADWRDGSYFCFPPCSTGDFYYLPTDSCVNECEQIRVEDDIVYCDQLPYVPNPGNNGTNNTNSTQGCPSIYEFKYPNGSCLASCPYPHRADWRDGSYFCSSPCSDDTYYYAPTDSCIDNCEQIRVEDDIVYCEQLPNVPNPGSNQTNGTNSTQGCDSIYEFKYPNGSCLASCSYPHRVDWRDGSYFCYPPCPDGDFYYAPTDTCVENCEQIRVEDDIVYCEQLPDVPNPGHNNTNNTNSTQGCSSMYEFKYPNGSCLTSCPYPHRADWHDGSYFCFPPCSDFSYYYAPTDSCVYECEQIRVEDDIVYCEQLPNIPNPANNQTNNTNSTQGCPSIYEFKYPNGSCLSDCPYPYKASWQDGSYFCSFPCPVEEYYYSSTGDCVDSCESEFIRVENEIVYCEGVSESVGCALFPQSDQTTTTNCTDLTGACPTGYFLFDDNSCRQVCPAKFTPHLNAKCSSPCGLNRALYPDGSCASNCTSGYTMRMEGSFKYCDANPTSETENLIIDIYIRYNISVADFNAIGGIEKFRQLLAALLGIDPSDIFINNIREGSTIIDSQIVVPSKSDSQSIASTKSKINTMHEKLENAAKNQGLRLEGVDVLDYSSSIIIPDDSTSQIGVQKSSSSSGAAIGIGVGLGIAAVVGVGLVIFSLYRNKQKQKLLKVREDAREKAYRVEPNIVDEPEGQAGNNQVKDEEICALAENSVVLFPEMAENNLDKIERPSGPNRAGNRIRINPRGKRGEMSFRGNDGDDKNIVQLPIVNDEVNMPSSLVLNDQVINYEEVANEKPLSLKWPQAEY